jgi:hypothetical protein
VFNFTGVLFPFVVPKELFSEQSEHRKIIEMGVPEGVPPGYKYRQVSL